jgi:hypothetical protein
MEVRGIMLKQTNENPLRLELGCDKCEIIGVELFGWSNGIYCQGCLENFGY